MRNIFLLSLMALLLTTSPRVSAASCEEKRELISSVLQQGTTRLRRSVDSIQLMRHLSDETKDTFQENAQWVIAWSQDQHAQIDRKECEELEDLMENIHVQWTPLQLQLFSMRATVLIWHIDQLIDGQMGDSSRSDLAEAQVLLRSVAEAEGIDEATFALRRAVFLTRNALRSVRKSAILE